MSLLDTLFYIFSLYPAKYSPYYFQCHILQVRMVDLKDNKQLNQSINLGQADLDKKSIKILHQIS